MFHNIMFSSMLGEPPKYGVLGNPQFRTVQESELIMKTEKIPQKYPGKSSTSGRCSSHRRCWYNFFCFLEIIAL